MSDQDPEAIDRLTKPRSEWRRLLTPVWGQVFICDTCVI